MSWGMRVGAAVFVEPVEIAMLKDLGYRTKA